MIELTEAQRQAIAGEENPLVIDPQTQAAYVLIRQEVFERLRGLLSEEGAWTADELRLLLARSSRANGWDEPGMEAYDRYDENRQCP